MIDDKQCPACGSDKVEARRVTQTTRLYGLEDVVFINLPVTLCAACGEETFSIPNHDVVMSTIRERLCWLRRTLSGREFAFLRQGLRLSGQQAAKVFGVSNVTISRWETGAQPVHHLADRLVRTLTLRSLSKRDPVEHFLRIEEHGIDRVEIDLENYDGGFYRSETSYRFKGSQCNAWVLNNVSLN